LHVLRNATNFNKLRSILAMPDRFLNSFLFLQAK